MDPEQCTKFGSKHSSDCNVYGLGISAGRNKLHHCWVSLQRSEMQENEDTQEKYCRGVGLSAKI